MLDYESLYQKGVSSKGTFFEILIEATYTALLRAGDVVVDAGANMGRHTMPLSRCVGPTGVVLAVEPIPALAERLSSECENNVRVFQNALADQQKIEADFFFVQHGHSISSLRSPIHHPLMTEDVARSIVTTKVKVTTINAICESQGLSNVRFMKMDIEGAEFHAIQGGDRLLNQSKPMIIFEFGFDESARNFDFSRDDFFSFFKRHDYNLFDLFGRRFDEMVWGKASVPWYLIAVCASSTDEEYIINIHPQIVSMVDDATFIGPDSGH
jgi:FkbM family methyltransferase